MRSYTRTVIASSVLALVAAAAGPLSASAAHASPAHVAPKAAAAHPAKGARSGWKPRAAQYPKTVTRHELAIPMSDGVILRGDLQLPANAAGKAIGGKWPVLVTI